MDKIWLIIKREYRIRVKHRLFLITTFLAPLGFLLFMGLSIGSALMDASDKLTVQVIDPSGKVLPQLQAASDAQLQFVPATAPLDTLKRRLLDDKTQAVLDLPEDVERGTLAASLYAAKTPGLRVERQIENRVRDAIRNTRLLNAGLTTQALSKLEVQLDINTRKLSQDGEKSSSAALGYAFGLIMAFLTYFMMLAYGQMVMTGVMEEKTTRIMEVIISSVKPIQLMIGKIVGIGMVGLTQIVLWGILIVLLSIGFFASLPLLGVELPAPDAAQSAEQASTAANFALALRSFNGWLALYFVIYFIGGFLIYGSMFAAIGSAVDQPQDAQQVAFIPILPIIVPMLFVNAIVANPTGALAWWFSMIPLFSPQVMMVRMAASDVPIWEILLSIFLLFGGAVLFGWIAGRIYRIGVLLYGKKVTPKELGRWIFAKV